MPTTEDLYQIIGLKEVLLLTAQGEIQTLRAQNAELQRALEHAPKRRTRKPITE